jgi:RNA recognition motif-containing protein
LKIYVGNLSFNTNDSSLNAAFAAFGEVASAEVVTDRETGRSRGFGFVEMPNQTEAAAAISGLNGTALDGRTINVNEARERSDRGPSRPRGGGYGGGGGGGYGGGGNRRW